MVILLILHLLFVIFAGILYFILNYILSNTFFQFHNTGGCFMKNSLSKKVAFAGFFIALGVLLPMIFHMTGFGGPIILPMHIPVLLAGFYLGGLYGLFVGFLTPLLSHFVTGMPPLSPVPMLIIMMFELSAYGFIAGILFTKTRRIFSSLIASMVGGRIVAGGVVWLLVNLFEFGQLGAPIVFISGAVVTGLPGIVLQLFLIPILVAKLKTDLIPEETLKGAIK